MIDLDTSRFKTPPMPHQLDGIKLILSKPNCALYDEMGTGKTKQVIDAACVLYEAAEIDTVVIICPAQVKLAWADEDFGEIIKHAWVPSTVTEFTSARPMIPHEFDRLLWVIVSYEYGRSEHNEEILRDELQNRKILMVADEASRLKNKGALQTKVFIRLKHQTALRGVLLDGTPLSNRNILDLYTKFAFLDKKILGFKNYYQFAARHVSMGGYLNKQAISYHNVEELNKKINPFLLRREKKDVLKDLLPKRYSVISAPLSDANWKMYKAMRDEMLIELKDEKSWAQHALTKQMRLSQITSGFLGGVQDSVEDEMFSDLDLAQQATPSRIKEIGSEKTHGLLNFLKELRESEGSCRVIIWGRFRAELRRMRQLLIDSDFPSYFIIGGQGRADRQEAVREFQEGDPKKPCILVGQPQAGGLGLNLTTAHRAFYLSNNNSLIDRIQSEDRIHRKGQPFECEYWDVIATGPKGQKTIDHATVKSLREMRDLASWTTDQWRKALTDE